MKRRLEINIMATGRYVVNDHHGYRFALMPGSAEQAPSEEKKMMKRDEHKMSKNATASRLFPQALWASRLVALRNMSLSLLFSLYGLPAPGATWEEDEREMSFFFRGSALQRRASRLQILDDENLG